MMTTELNNDTDTAVELHRIITASLTHQFGMSEIPAAALADQITVGFRREAGGAPIYVPAPNQKVRDQQIRAEFSGRNHVELAKKYQISSRRVRQIIASR